MKKRFLLFSVTMLFVLSSLCVYADVQFMGKDTDTGGDWVGVYGANGAILFGIADEADMKNIVSLEDNGQRYDWANPTDDERGLISINDPNVRIANCMYNNPVGLLTLETSLDSYQVALFAFDWDSEVRIEEMVGYQGDTAPDAPDVTVENPEFHQGVYYKWAVTGSDPFNIQITFIGGANWVASGLFVDEVLSSAVQASGKLASTWGGIRAEN